MALNFGLLDTNLPAEIAGSYTRAQQAQQAQQERNMLRQQQMMSLDIQRQNMLGQKEERDAQAAKRRGDEARAAQRQTLLKGASEALAQGGHKLDRPTLMKVLQSGIEADEPTLIQFGKESLKALDEEEQFQREMAGFGFGKPSPAPQAPAAAPFDGELPTTPGVTSAPVAPRAMPAPMALPPAGGPAVPSSIRQAPAVVPGNALNVGGVSVDRNMLAQMAMSPNKGVRDRAAALVGLLPKEATVAPTNLAKLQAELAALPPGDPRRKDYEALIRKETTHAPATSVSVKLPEQEKQERGERGKLLVKQYEGVADTARLAAKTLPSLETQERVLDSGFKTGFGTDAQKAGASVLSALGVPEADKYATNAQTFLAATQQAVLQRQLEQKGPQTEADAQRITQTGAQLGNTTNANKFLISTAKAQLKRDIQQRNFYDKWWKENKTYDGAEDAWFNGEGGKSLFESPELKQYAPPKSSPPAEAPGRNPKPSVVPSYSDAEKERRYQEWKRKQGQP